MSSTGCILFRLEESLKELAEKSLYAAQEAGQ